MVNILFWKKEIYMLYQYKIFVAKEFKQFCKNKKIILICFLATMYTPFINCMSTPEQSILPYDFVIPLFVLWGCMYPSELTYSIMKEEYTTKSIEILYVSKIKPIVIILSKLTVPIIISFIIAIVSIIFNNIAVEIIGTGLSINITDIFYLCIILSVIILNSNMYLSFLLTGDETLDKHVFTAMCGVGFVTTAFIFAVHFYVSFWFAMLILIIASTCLIALSARLIEKPYQLSKLDSKKGNYLIFKNFPFMNLCLESCARYLKIKNLVVLIVSMILFHIGLTTLNFNGSFLCVPYFIIIANSLIFRSTLMATKYKSFKYYRLARVSMFKTVLSRILIPLLFCFLIMLVTLLMQSTFTFFVVIEMILTSILVCLMSLCCSLFIRELKYEKQYTLLSTFVMFLVVFSLSFLHTLALFLLVLLLYSANMFLFYKRSCSEM